MKLVSRYGYISGSKSPPHTGAWIETYIKLKACAVNIVAPLHGGVD